MPRFSKFKKRIESFFAPELDLKIYCTTIPDDWDTDENGNPYRGVYYCDVMFVTDMIHEYLETPVDVLFDCTFENDYFGVVDLLRAADRRIGKKRLVLLRDRTQSQAAIKIIDARLNQTGVKTSETAK